MPEPTESLFTNEQNVIDWLADRFMEHLEKEASPLLAARSIAARAENILYFATGRKFEVRQVIPPPTNPRATRVETVITIRRDGPGHEGVVVEPRRGSLRMWAPTRRELQVELAEWLLE